MRFTLLTLALSVAGLAAAQSSSGPAAPQPSSDCSAQNIVDACRKTIQAQIDACKTNEWICLCEQYTNLLTCYNNCPDSSERSPVQNQVTSFCNAAAPLKSASAASAASAGVTAGPSSSGASSSASSTGEAGAFESQSGSATATGAEASGTNAAGSLVAPASGAFAVLLGLAGLL